MKFSPIIFAMLIWLVRALTLSILELYDRIFIPGDIIFSALAFDLWAVISVGIYGAPLTLKPRRDYRDEDYATPSEKLFILLSTNMHIILYFWITSMVANNIGFREFLYYIDISIIIVVTFYIVYLVPALLLRRAFKD